MIWIILGIIVVLVLIVVGVYNGLVKSRMQMAASDALSRQVAGIFAVAENYPDLKANTNFMQLQEELTNTENKISYARQLYNSVTSNYNVKLETFPTNVIAGMFGFRQAEFLQVPEEEKAVPKVDFS